MGGGGRGRGMTEARVNSTLISASVLQCTIESRAMAASAENYGSSRKHEFGCYQLARGKKAESLSRRRRTFLDRAGQRVPAVEQRERRGLQEVLPPQPIAGVLVPAEAPGSDTCQRLNRLVGGSADGSCQRLVLRRGSAEVKPAGTVAWWRTACQRTGSATAVPR